MSCKGRLWSFWLKTTILMIPRTTDKSHLLISLSFNELYTSAYFKSTTKLYFLWDLLQFSKKSDKVENQFFSKQLEMFRFCSNKNTRVEPVLYLVDWWHLKKKPIMQERIEGELLLFHSVYMMIVVGCLFLFQALLLHQFGDELWSLGRNWFTRDVLHMGMRPTDIEKKQIYIRKKQIFWGNNIICRACKHFS